jgi:hypothetical protein
MEVVREPKPPSAPGRALRALRTKIPIRQRRTLLFLSHNKRLPRLRHPRTYNEKVNWRVLYDRRPEIAWTCDKLASKRKAEEACPSIRIPQVYWSGTDLGELTSVDLPDEWILKPNAASGLVLKGEGLIDRAKLSELIRLTDGWLDQDLAGRIGEWAYSQAERCFLVEEVIGDWSDPAVNYKAHVFDGEVLFWDVEKLMGGGKMCFITYTHEWQLVHDNPTADPKYQPCGEIQRPALLEELESAAKVIAGGLDYLRVDLYGVAGEVWFGETCPYPSSGLDPGNPEDDFEWGGFWRLPGF